VQCAAMPPRRAVTTDNRTKPKRKPKRARLVRTVRTGAATVVLTLRAYFDKEAAARKSFNLFWSIQRMAEATGLSPASISHMATEKYVDTRPENGTPETRRSSRRVPQEELARVRKSIFAQYHIPMLPTLDQALAGGARARAPLRGWVRARAPPGERKRVRNPAGALSRVRASEGARVLVRGQQQLRVVGRSLALTRLAGCSVALVAALRLPFVGGNAQRLRVSGAPGRARPVARVPPPCPQVVARLPSMRLLADPLVLEVGRRRRWQLVMRLSVGGPAGGELDMCGLVQLCNVRCNIWRFPSVVGRTTMTWLGKSRRCETNATTLWTPYASTDKPGGRSTIRARRG